MCEYTYAGWMIIAYTAIAAAGVTAILMHLMAEKEYASGKHRK